MKPKGRLFGEQLLNELPNADVEARDSGAYLPVSYSFTCILTRPVSHVETSKSHRTYKFNRQVCENVKMQTAALRRTAFTHYFGDISSPTHVYSVLSFLPACKAANAALLFASLFLAASVP